MVDNAYVSILIPVYNREKCIAKTIESAISQTYTNIEVIIVDNCSSDGTWAIIQDYVKKDNRVKAFQNDCNIGPVRNWKRCVDEARGKYGKILWSDDLISSDFIEKTLPFMENNSNIGFVYTGIETFNDDTDEKISIYCPSKTGKYLSRQYIEGILLTKGKYPVSPGCAIFRMDDLRKNLLVQVSNKIGSDFSMHAIGNDVLIFLLTAHDYDYFGYIHEKLSFFRVHQDSITVSSKVYDYTLLYSLAKAYYVDNCITDISLLKKFNSKLFLQCIRYKKNTIGLTQLSDFYLHNKIYTLSYIFLVKSLIQSFYSFIKQRFKPVHVT